jgi:L-alanine-DL-glutamate epimerase-like enolase superfamily enzyme
MEFYVSILLFRQSWRGEKTMRRREFLSTGVAAICGTVSLAGERLQAPECWLPAQTTGPATEIADLQVIRVRKKGNAKRIKQYLTVKTDAGVIGIGGDLYQEQARRLEELAPRLRTILIGRDPRLTDIDSEWLWKKLYPEHPLEAYAEGRDPLTNAKIWGTRRASRHTKTGSVIMALSAVDNALWDLRGKLAGVSVYRLLGGSRSKLPAYISLMPSQELEDTRTRARVLFDKGFKAQKWFLKHGPPDGKVGFRAIVKQVETLRNELGSTARLMFDFSVGERGRCDWDLSYAIEVAKAIAPFKPFWLEEPFSPEEIDAYEGLQAKTTIPLATGEHTYTRWNIKPFLERNLVRFVQCDPEWCGGISELLKICAMVKGYENVQLIPHGHHVLAAAHVVASQPEGLCPMVEYGEGWIPGRQDFQGRAVTPEDGYLTVPTEPGLGPSLDYERIEQV